MIGVFWFKYELRIILVLFEWIFFSKALVYVDLLDLYRYMANGTLSCDQYLFKLFWPHLEGGAQ